MNTLQHKEFEEPLISKSSVPLLAGQEAQTPSPQEALTYLLDLIGTEENEQQFIVKARKRFISIFLLWFVFFLFFCILAVQIPTLSPMPFVVSVVGILCLTTPAFWWQLGHRIHCLRRQVKETLPLAESKGERIVEPLLDILAITPSAYRASLLPTITEYLWEVRPEDSYRLLKGRSRDILRREIWKLRLGQLPADREEIEVDFSTAAMKALAFSADGRAIPILHNRTRIKGDTLNARVVRDVARECLNILDTEAARRTVARRTLRELLGAKKETPATLVLQDAYLNSLGPERAKLALTELLEEEGRKTEGIKVLCTVIRTIPLAFIFTIPKAKGSTYTFFLFCVPFVFSWFFDALFVPGNIAVQAATRLCRYSDKQTVGTLLDALRYEYLNDSLIPIVASLLMQFTEGDGDLLSMKQREYLRKTMQRSYHTNKYSRSAPRFQASFLVATIHALTVIGDKETNPLLEKALREHPLAPVREAAEQAIVERRA